MRPVPAYLLCLVIGGCSSMADLPPPAVEAPPDQAQIAAGLNIGISDSKFPPPIEVTDAFSAPASSTQPWIVCVRSRAPDQARRLTYSVFYGKNAAGKEGQYAKSRYSVFADDCDGQPYHLYGVAAHAPAAPSPSPTPEPKKQHRHQQ